MRTTMITFAGHTFHVRSDAEEPFDITALDMFKAELERLKKTDALGDLAAGKEVVGEVYTLSTQDPAVALAHLRDEFAKSAMNALLTVNNVSEKAIAEAAYRIADAMLAARDQPKPDAP